MAQLAQRLHGNQGPPYGEQTALRMKHPTGNRTEGPVRTFTDEMIPVAIFHSLHNTEKFSKQGMPAIANGGGLKKVGIM